MIGAFAPNPRTDRNLAKMGTREVAVRGRRLTSRGFVGSFTPALVHFGGLRLAIAWGGRAEVKDLLDPFAPALVHFGGLSSALAWREAG